ncbi:MAG TPA: proline dehydrogenase family protein [Candidatus Acidoferrum sp.]|nr:proline dehydrogenase family protein [Candidatus Acidoferrum sp.]
MRRLLLRLADRPRIGATMDRLALTRRFVRRFVAGREAGDALAVLGALDESGLTSAVTCLGENVGVPADAERATVTYLGLLEAIGQRKLRTTPSLKLTHLGLDLDEGLCVGNLMRVVARAGEVGTRVWIDMESSRYTERTLDLYARLRPAHPQLGCVVQAYLRRTPGDVERLIALGATVRLCKGAYREPAALAYPDKRDVDASYARLAERLLDPDALARGVYPGFATHDERLQRHVRQLAAERGIAADRFEIQMLYGIRPDLHARLRDAGVALRVLVPFGEDWYGYFMRRLAERPANLLFLLRHAARR